MLFDAPIIKIKPGSTYCINPFDIDKKPQRDEILGKLKALTAIANKHGETVTFELVKELSDKNGFNITAMEINDILKGD